MPLRRIRADSQSPRRVPFFAAVLCVYALLVGALPAQEDDDFPALPGPRAEDLPGEPGELTLIPSLPKNCRITGRYETYVDPNTKRGHIRGNIQCRTDNGLQLFADEAIVDDNKKFIQFNGNVSVYQGAVLHRGDSATFHYEEERLEAEGLRSGLDPVLLEAGKFRMVESEGRRYYIGENAGITTDDRKDPSFWIKADQSIVIPGEGLFFRNMKIFAGDTQVFWLPFFSQQLDRDLGYHFVPGARSNWGPYLLNRYGTMLGGKPDPHTGQSRDAWLLSQWHFDLLSRRGLGTGVDLFDKRIEDNDNLGWLKFYYIHDLDPNLERSGVPRDNIEENRFRAQLRHRLELMGIFPGGETYLDADFTLLSDRFYLEDFQPAEFRTEPNPDNILALTHVRDRNLFTFWTRLRPNGFYRSDTRLPEIALDQVRHPLFGTGLLHEGQISFGLYDEHLPDFQRRSLRRELAGLLPGDPRRTELTNFLAERGFTRFHLWQELSHPMDYDGWLNLVPRAGVGYTNYADVDGIGSSTERKHAFVGVDASVKFSRSYDHIKNDSLGLDGLLHIVQPYASFSLLSTNELDSSFPKIDRLTASTRSRPLGVGRFTAIDDLQNWNIIRLGARNRLLTKRDGDTHEWLTLDSYFDWFLDDPEFEREFSNLYNDIRFSPLPWLEAALETQFPIFSREGDFTEVAASFRFMPTEDLEISFHHRFLDNHPILQNSTRLEYEVYQRINEDWGAGFLHRWEWDDGTLEYQQYAIHHTLQNWALSLGVFHRDNRDHDEFGFTLGITLREFPSVNLPLKVDTE